MYGVSPSDGRLPCQSYDYTLSIFGERERPNYSVDNLCSTWEGVSYLSCVHITYLRTCWLFPCTTNQKLYHWNAWAFSRKRIDPNYLGSKTFLHQTESSLYYTCIARNREYIVIMYACMEHSVGTGVSLPLRCLCSHTLPPSNYVYIELSARLDASPHGMSRSRLSLRHGLSSSACSKGQSVQMLLRRGT